MPDRRFRIRAPADEFDRHPLLELLVGPLGEEYGSHPPTADLPDHAVCPDPVPALEARFHHRKVSKRFPHRRRAHGVLRGLVRLHQLLYFL